MRELVESGVAAKSALGEEAKKEGVVRKRAAGWYEGLAEVGDKNLQRQH